MPQKKRLLRVGISDDSPFIVYSIQTILAAEFALREVSAYPIETETLLAQLKQEPPDILITDFSFSFERNDLNGVKRIEEVYLQMPELNIIVLTAQSSQAILKKLLQIPISAIVSKRDNRRELIGAFHWVCSGNKNIFYSEQMRCLSKEASCGANEGLLSPSEVEVIRFFAMGYSLMDIARLRKRSVSTVATQKYNAMRKLQLHSNTDLIKYAFAQELI